MKFPKEDFPLIRNAVILLAVTVVLSIAGIAGSIYAKESMQKSKNDDLNQLEDSRAKLSQVREEEQQIHRYHAKYLKLMDEGIFGKEDRLQWIENILQIKENRKLFGLDYQIDAQQPVQVDAALDQGNLAMYGSTMKLGFSLLHEEDLFNALNDLRGKSKGLGLLRECMLTRTDTRADKGAGIFVIPHLKAECTLVWLSLKPKESPQDAAEAP
jgi:hypothetical protein